MAGKLTMIKFLKMKKKIVFAVATGFFAVATVFNMNLLQANFNRNVSLDAISVMSKAEAQSFSCPNGCLRTKGMCYCHGFKPYSEARHTPNKPIHR